jgi:uncharacterized protein YjiS (DUF1127 family)
MNVAELFWQLTGSRSLHNSALPTETSIERAITALALWRERGRQRRALAGLDAARLRDIGRSRQEVAQECAKPIWRA